MLVLAVAFFGLCHGMRAVAVMGLLGRFFGTRALGELTGVIIAVGQLFSAPAPYLVGYWFDTGHSYAATFVIMSVGLALGAIMVLLADRRGTRSPARPATGPRMSDCLCAIAQPRYY
jgi:cyanate permease